MGADTFFHYASGKTVSEAFASAQKEARYDFGHSGYTGTIAEKDSYIVISCPTGENPEDFADDLIGKCDPRIDNKWGPAGCIKLDRNKYLFFGWASS